MASFCLREKWAATPRLFPVQKQDRGRRDRLQIDLHLIERLDPFCRIVRSGRKPRAKSNP
jgi:hypothetical protein